MRINGLGEDHFHNLHQYDSPYDHRSDPQCLEAHPLQDTYMLLEIVNLYNGFHASWHLIKILAIITVFQENRQLGL